MSNRGGLGKLLSLSFNQLPSTHVSLATKKRHHPIQLQTDSVIPYPRELSPSGMTTLAPGGLSAPAGLRLGTQHVCSLGQCIFLFQDY